MRNVLYNQYEGVVVYQVAKGQNQKHDNAGNDRIIKKGNNLSNNGGFEALLSESIKHLA